MFSRPGGEDICIALKIKTGDGLPDMVVHIITQDINLSAIVDGFTELYAILSDGQEIVATGDINIVETNCYRYRHMCRYRFHHCPDFFGNRGHRAHGCCNNWFRFRNWHNQGCGTNHSCN